MIRFNEKNLIWIYLWLLIFEGALRKWAFPELSSPLLIIREPLLLLIYWIAFSKGRFPVNIWIMMLWILAIVMALCSLFLKDANLFVIAYGFRTNFLHIPLIFIMGNVLNEKDLQAVSKFIIRLLLPMGILMALQFKSAPEAFINTTAGGEGAQIGGTEGNIRPPGTFSFITGVAEFFGLATALYVNVFMTQKTSLLRLMLAGAGICLGLSFSISRLALGYVSIVLIMMLISVFLNPTYLSKVLIVFIFVTIIVISTLQTDYVQHSLASFSERIKMASEVEGGGSGFFMRVLQDYSIPLELIDNVPVMGYGLGSGTAVGAKLLTGDQSMILGESEWSRIILESGLGLGGLFIAWRCIFAIALGVQAFRATMQGYPLPFLLFGACHQLILVGQISRPTTLGFMVVGAGLCVASLKIIKGKVKTEGRMI